MPRRPCPLRRPVPAFTLVELLTALGIVSLLASFLLPVFTQAASRARRASDQSALRQLASAWLMYCQDHDETAMPSPLPTPHSSPGTSPPPGPVAPKRTPFAGLQPYLGGTIPKDPAAHGLAPDPIWGTVHHAYNSAYVGGAPAEDPGLKHGHGWHTVPVSLSRIEVPWDTLVFCDSGRYVPEEDKLDCTLTTWPPSGAAHHPPTIHARHAGRANVAFADGHACAVTVTVPEILPMAPRWRTANLGWVVRRGRFDDSLYNGQGVP